MTKDVVLSNARTLVGKAVGFGLVLAALSSAAYAQTAPATPEIDPGSMLSALALLSCGVMILKDRSRRK